MCTDLDVKSLAHILGASARLELLRALRHQHDLVGLRQLARLAGVHPHSAERFLKDLVREGLVVCHRTPARTLYRKNAAHSDWLVLQAVDDAAEHAAAELHRSVLNKRARSLLPFIEEAREMLLTAKEPPRVP